MFHRIIPLGEPIVSQSFESSQSVDLVSKDLVFSRGIRVCREGCFLVKLFGFCLLLISLIKTILTIGTTITYEWKLALVGILLLITGSALGRSKSLQSLFSIQSKGLTKKRSLFIRNLLNIRQNIQ